MNAQPNVQDAVEPDLELDDGIDTDHDVDTDHDFDTEQYDSYSDGTPLAHHVINPALLAGFADVPIEVCRVFHDVLFEQLDGVGSFDGFIGTPEVMIAPAASDRWTAVFDWLHEHPAPDADAMFEAHLDAGYEPGEAGEHVVHTVTQHSLALAERLGSNPSLTYASHAALSEAIYVSMRAEMSRRDALDVDVLTDVAMSLLAITSRRSRLQGGAEVIDTGLLLEFARSAASV